MTEWLINGDCLEEMKQIPDGCVDLILTDPPYGTTACKWDSIIPLAPMWKQLKRVIKPNGAIVLFGAEPFSSYLRISNIKNYKYDWIWRKPRHTSPLLAKKQPMRYTELISVFYKKQCLYNPQMVKRKKDNFRDNKTSTGTEHTSEVTGSAKLIGGNNLNPLIYPANVLEFSTQWKPKHPTQKPVALMEYLVKTYTNEGEIVLDFTMGSGTTGVACRNTGRDFIGIELDEKYFELAKQRIEEA